MHSKYLIYGFLEDKKQKTFQKKNDQNILMPRKLKKPEKIQQLLLIVWLQQHCWAIN